jgi:hypothetical protein
MEEKSLLAQLLEADTDQRRLEIYQTSIENILRSEMEEVGLYVYDSSLDYVGPTGFTGTITVADDGMPKRAQAAVEEILRAQGIEEFDWRDYPVPGQVSVSWEVEDEPETE